MKIECSKFQVETVHSASKELLVCNTKKGLMRENEEFITEVECLSLYQSLASSVEMKVAIRSGLVFSRNETFRILGENFFAARFCACVLFNSVDWMISAIWILL